MVVLGVLDGGVMREELNGEVVIRDGGIVKREVVALEAGRADPDLGDESTMAKGLRTERHVRQQRRE